MVRKVFVAEPRGFCAGVEMAIKALSFLSKAFAAPVFCYHEIVHNKVVVERFRKQGVIFVDSIDEVPEGAIVMLSAHGSAPEIVASSAEKGRFSINAVCPLVTKVHHEAKTRAKKGYDILYVGHEGHDEAIGTMAIAPENMHLIVNEDDMNAYVEKNPHGDNVALLAQTTLALSEWEVIADKAREKYPELWTAGRSDLCFATTNRQTALKELATKCNVLLILGSSNSSNTLALEKVARETGCERVHRIETAAQVHELQLQQDDIVGITAGASAPEDIVQEVVAQCGSQEPVETLRAIDEDEYFPPPSQLRDLAIDFNFAVDAIFAAVSIDDNRSTPDVKKVFSHDRQSPAAASLVA